jgi:hypothetical protein
MLSRTPPDQVRGYLLPVFLLLVDDQGVVAVAKVPDVDQFLDVSRDGLALAGLGPALARHRVNGSFATKGEHATIVAELQNHCGRTAHKERKLSERSVLGNA